MKIIKEAAIVRCLLLALFLSTLSDAFSQAMSKHCENGACVTWGGVNQCSADTECAGGGTLPPCDCDANDDGIPDDRLPTNCDPSGCNGEGPGKQRACCQQMTFCSGGVATAKDNYCGAPDVPCCPYVCLSSNPSRVFECCGPNDRGGTNQCFPSCGGNEGGGDCAYDYVQGAPLADGEPCLEGNTVSDGESSLGCGNPGTCLNGACIPNASPPPGGTNNGGNTDSLPDGGFSNPPSTGSDTDPVFRRPGNSTCPPAYFKSHPQSRTVPAGGAVNFTAQIENPGILKGCRASYQWEFKPNGAATFSPIFTANVLSFDIVNVNNSDAGTYRLKLSTPGGFAYSGPAVLTVTTPQPAPIVGLIAIQPVSAVCSTLGASVQFLITPAPGKTLTYQWEFMRTGTNTFVALADLSAKTKNLLLTNCRAEIGGDYRVKVREGTTEEISDAVKLILPQPNPLRIVTQPVGNTGVALGAPVNLSISVTGGTAPIRYQWQRKLIDLTIFTDIPGANAAAFSIAAFNPARDEGEYRVIIRESATSRELASATAYVGLRQADLTKTQKPQAVVPIASRSGASGGTVSITPRLIGATPFTYRWLYNGTEIAGTTNLATLSRPISAATIGGYTVEVRNANGLYTQSFTINTTPTPLRVAVLLDEVAISTDLNAPTLLDLGAVTMCSSDAPYSELTVLNMSSATIGYDVTIPNGVALVPSSGSILSYGPTTMQLFVPAGQRGSVLLGIDRRSTATLPTSSAVTVNVSNGALLRSFKVKGAYAAPSPSPSGVSTPCPQ